jgi:hypothetical protein
MQEVWNILSLERIKSSGFVTNIRYSVNVTESNITATKTGMVKFEERESGFIPFDELTENEVVDWVKNKLGNEVPKIVDELKDEIELKLTPKSEIVVPPWAPE